jgi:hypothetical protein
MVRERIAGCRELRRKGTCVIERAGEKEGGVCSVFRPMVAVEGKQAVVEPGTGFCQLGLRVVRGRVGLRSKQPRVFGGDGCTSCVGGEGGRVDDLRIIPEMAIRLKQSYCSEQRHSEETANGWCSSSSSSFMLSKGGYTFEKKNRPYAKHKSPSLFPRRSSFVVLTLDRGGRHWWQGGKKTGVTVLGQ